MAEGGGGGIIGGIDPRLRIVIAVIAVLFIAGILFLFRSCGTKDPNAGYTVIYSNLDLKDAANVITQLKTLKIPYQIRENGSSVAVLKEKADEARLGLAEKNLPTGGSVGWEIFDQSRLGTTDFDRRIQFVRAISGELSRTIKRIEVIEDARIQIVIPQTSLFEVAKAPVTASVLLQLKKGRQLTNEQISGIIYLVANSVENLRAENVTIVDVYGNMLSGGPLGKEATIESVSEIKQAQAVEIPILPTREVVLPKVQPSIVIGTKEAVVSATKEIISVMVPVKKILTPEEKVLTGAKAKEELENLFSIKIQKLVNNFYPPNSILVKAIVDIEEAPVVIPYRKKYRRYYRKRTDLKVEKKERIKKIAVIVLVDNRFSLTSNLRKTTLNTIASAISFDKKRGDKITIAQVPFHYATEYPTARKIVEKLPVKEESSLKEKFSALLKQTVIKASIGVLLAIIIIVFAAKRFLGRKRKPNPIPPQEEAGKKSQAIAEIRSYVAQSPEKIAELLKKWLSEEEAA